MHGAQHESQRINGMGKHIHNSSWREGGKSKALVHMTLFLYNDSPKHYPQPNRRENKFIVLGDVMKVNMIPKVVTNIQ